MDNLFQFLDKILPLISTLLGAYITYFVTVSSKKSELKVNAQTKEEMNIGYHVLLQFQICRKK